MTFSLIRFLEVNYIMLICFPSLGYLLCTNGNDKENFSRTFCTNFVNILVFTYFLYPTNFSFIVYHSFNFITLVCPKTVARAAPATPISGNGPIPNIKTGSKTILIRAPTICTIIG